MDVSTFEAKNRLSALLDTVANGGEVTITRRGKAIARLVPAHGGFDREKASRAAQSIVTRSKGVTLDGISLKDLIAEGRR